MAAPWPSFDVARARELYESGLTVEQVGQVVGVTKSKVSVHLRRAGVVMRPGRPGLAPVPTETIIRLREEGLTWQELADTVGMSPAGVRQRYLAGTGHPRQRSSIGPPPPTREP